MTVTTVGSTVDEPSLTPSRHWGSMASVWVCGALLVLAGTRLEAKKDVTWALLGALALAPVWWRHAASFRWWRALLVAAAAAVVAGGWLTWWHDDRLGVSSSLLVSVSMMVVDLVCAVALLLWARCIMPMSAAVVLFCVGMAYNSTGAARFGENVWRFGFGPSVTLIVLAVVATLRRTWLSIAATLALTAIWALARGRSAAAVMAMTAVAVSVQALLRHRRARLSRTQVVVGAAVIGGVVFWLGQAAALGGYLGDSAQERSQAQVEQSGSLLAGGRPEMGATFGLFAHDPFGYGSGALPDGRLLTVAKVGMTRLNYDPDNGYVEEYMMGSTTGIELHSVLGDLWARSGLAGVALALVLAASIFGGVVDRFARQSASALGVFLAVTFMWDLCFTPFWSALSSTALAFAVLAGPRLVRATADPPGPDVRTALRLSS